RATSVPAMIDETGSVFVRRVRRLTSAEHVAPRGAWHPALLIACALLAVASLVAPRFETQRHSLGLNYDRRFTRRVVDAPVGAEGVVEQRIIIDTAVRGSADSVETRRIL